MDVVLYFFRDTISGMHYVLYALFLLILLFAIIGYLFKQKYGKLEIKFDTSKSKKEKNSNVVNTKNSFKSQEIKKESPRVNLKQNQVMATNELPIKERTVNNTENTLVKENNQVIQNGPIPEIK